MVPPLEVLTEIVIILFKLGEDDRLPQEQRKKAHHVAEQLHEYSKCFLEKQFDSTTKQYETTINQMNRINSDLVQAADNIQNLIDTVNNAAALVGAIEDLLKTAASFGTISRG